MTVKELIERLSKLDPSLMVILSSDSEGNMYSPLCDIDDEVPMNYLATSSYSGEVGLAELNDELRSYGFSEEDVMTDGAPCVVLYP